MLTKVLKFFKKIQVALLDVCSKAGQDNLLKQMDALDAGYEGICKSLTATMKICQSLGFNAEPYWKITHTLADHKFDAYRAQANQNPGKYADAIAGLQECDNALRAMIAAHTTEQGGTSNA